MTDWCWDILVLGQTDVGTGTNWCWDRLVLDCDRLVLDWHRDRLMLGQISTDEGTDLSLYYSDRRMHITHLQRIHVDQVTDVV